MPDEDCEVICSNCGLKFRLGTTYRTRSPNSVNLFASTYEDYTPIDEMTFPKEDASEVELTCPHCRKRNVYPHEKIFFPSQLVYKERELRLKEEGAGKLQTEVETLREEVRQLRQQNADKDKILNEQLGNLTEAYMKLAKFIREELPKMLSEGSRKPVNYEETHH